MGKPLIPFPKRRDQLWGPKQSRIEWVQTFSFPGGERLEREADHSHLSNTEVTNRYGKLWATHIPPYAFIVCAETTSPLSVLFHTSPVFNNLVSDTWSVVLIPAFGYCI